MVETMTPLVHQGVSGAPLCDLPFRAMQFAREAHAKQARKYTGTPYVEHLGEVAGITASVASHEQLPTMVATAWLHDFVEDQRAPDDIDGGRALDQVRDLFGEAVAYGVSLLSDLEQGNRAQRKAQGCLRLSKAPAWVQTIKCADLISHTASIALHDPKFAVVYLAEKRALLDVLTQAHPQLRAIAYGQQP